METKSDWIKEARESLVNGALEKVYPAVDIRDLELRGINSVAHLGLIMEATKENLFDYLKNFEGNFEELKQKTILRVKGFLTRYVK